MSHSNCYNTAPAKTQESAQRPRLSSPDFLLNAVDPSSVDVAAICDRWIQPTDAEKGQWGYYAKVCRFVSQTLGVSYDTARRWGQVRRQDIDFPDMPRHYRAYLATLDEKACEQLAETPYQQVPITLRELWRELKGISQIAS